VASLPLDGNLAHFAVVANVAPPSSQPLTVISLKLTVSYHQTVATILHLGIPAMTDIDDEENVAASGEGVSLTVWLVLHVLAAPYAPRPHCITISLLFLPTLTRHV
jgi:hypothetical protein